MTKPLFGSVGHFITFPIDLLTKTVYEKKFNKLGQRQSQTPFSSAFWVQKYFQYRKLLGPKKFQFRKFFVSNKILGQKDFGSKKFWFKKLLGQQKFWFKKQNQLRLRPTEIQFGLHVKKDYLVYKAAYNYYNFAESF